MQIKKKRTSEPRQPQRASGGIVRQLPLPSEGWIRVGRHPWEVAEATDPKKVK